MATTRAIQASRWSLGITYGLGALLLGFGGPAWVGWLVIGLFLATLFVTVREIRGLHDNVSEIVGAKAGTAEDRENGTANGLKTHGMTT